MWFDPGMKPETTVTNESNKIMSLLDTNIQIHTKQHYSLTAQMAWWLKRLPLRFLLR